MAYTCINAAEEMVKILRDLAACELLSDLSFFDTNCLLKTAMIFLLAKRFRNNESDVENYDSSIRLLERLSKMEWAAEVVARLRLLELETPSEPPANRNMIDVATEHLGSCFNQNQPRDEPSSSLDAELYSSLSEDP